MQRRLASVTFRTEIAEDAQGPSIAVEDPSGLAVMRWYHMPDWQTLSEILALVELAGPHVLEAHRATLDNEPFVAERERALMALAFGDRIRGKKRLEAMLVSESKENWELAAIWLERLNAVRPGAKVRDEILAKHARDGSTDRVRFEAWMALGDISVVQERYENAIDAYDRAVAIGGGKFSRQNALAARQQAADLALPVSGLGVPGTVIAGKRSVQPRNLSKNVAAAEYRLDGNVVTTSRRKPFAATIPFDRIPKRQVLEVTTRDRAGNVVNRGVAVVNERSEAFDVDFIEPRQAFVSGQVEVAVAARVPRGRAVEELTIEWNGNRVARFTAPPYRARVNIAEGEQGVLRAVLRLDDGAEVEDVYVANAGMVLEADAHLVEVPAYFESDPQNVIVRENRIERTVERIIKPADAPLLIGLLIDASSSMTPHMLDVQEAAVRFVEENIEPRDRTMIVSFSSNVRVLLRPSRDRSAVQRSILSIRPYGGTALYDAMVNALLQLQSSGSRKALVLFSDGLDGDSAFSAADVAEVARRAGVPIYILNFAPEEDTKQFMELSARTGGKSFAMRSLEGLDALFAAIGADLRRQSLLIYRTESAGEEWRPISITMRGQKVRAPSGVFVTPD